MKKRFKIIKAEDKPEVSFAKLHIQNLENSYTGLQVFIFTNFRGRRFLFLPHTKSCGNKGIYEFKKNAENI